MWERSEIEIDLEIVEHDEMIVSVRTPVGVLQIAGCVTRIDRTLLIDGAHVQGLSPGALGRNGAGRCR